MATNENMDGAESLGKLYNGTLRLATFDVMGDKVLIILSRIRAAIKKEFIKGTICYYNVRPSVHCGVDKILVAI